MINSNFLNPLNSIRLICMDNHFDEMIKLYNINKFPKVFLLNGKKGIGKFTLVLHFLNYIFSKNEETSYNVIDKKINIKSIFYNQLLNQTNQDILFLRAEENKNIKIEDVRNLKSILSRSNLSENPRFIIIDEVEFFNDNSVNALLKSLEEPTVNNFFILINNKQANLIKTLSSRCLPSNIFLSSNDAQTVIDLFLDNNNIEKLINKNINLSPGLFLKFNDIYLKYSLIENDPILTKIYKLLNGYKKNKEKTLISLALFLIDQHFLKLVQNNKSQLDFLLNIKSSIIKNINDLLYYNLNINSVLNSIEIKLNNVQR